eukprot:SAG11_NODE_1065_length_5989_cov_103.088285_6_plen_89_part_00
MALCTTAAKGQEVLAIDATHAARVAQQIEVDKQLAAQKFERESERQFAQHRLDKAKTAKSRSTAQIRYHDFKGSRSASRQKTATKTYC